MSVIKKVKKYFYLSGIDPICIDPIRIDPIRIHKLLKIPKFIRDVCIIHT